MRGGGLGALRGCAVSETEAFEVTRGPGLGTNSPKSPRPPLHPTDASNVEPNNPPGVERA